MKLAEPDLYKSYFYHYQTDMKKEKKTVWKHVKSRAYDLAVGPVVLLMKW